MISVTLAENKKHIFKNYIILKLIFFICRKQVFFIIMYLLLVREIILQSTIMSGGRR